MRTTRAAQLALSVLSLLAVAPPVSAQVQIGGFGLEGNVEVGWRFFVDEPAESRRAKWQEYRDITGGPILPDLSLRLFRPDESYSTSLSGSKWGQADQEF